MATFRYGRRAALAIVGALLLASCNQSAPTEGGNPAMRSAKDTGEARGSGGSSIPSDEELRARLTPEQYRVTRECGTEPPFANAYWNNHREGIYVDVISGKPLFSSKDKFDSGSGWPSFTAPLDDGAVAAKPDTSHGMVRTEVRSTASDAHLGHVFDDGPAPTGLRYCVNSASLRFIPAEDLEREGYGEYAKLFARGGEKATSGAAASEKGSAKTEIATFAAGCFWGIEAAFRKVPGVVDATVGYSGGTLENPTYKDVCTDRTGHAEVVRVEYDPSRVSYEKLLETFWQIHDPTQVNRQGPDVGTQYRTAIFFHTPAQEAAARAAKKALEESGRFKRPIATEISAAGPFWRAEEYHQQYLAKRGQDSCGIAPH